MTRWGLLLPLRMDTVGKKVLPLTKKVRNTTHNIKP